jgi:hypothetical protein
MKPPKSLPEEYEQDISPYIVQLEQLLIVFREELEVVPNAGFSPEMNEILDRTKAVIVEGQIKRQAFGLRLRKECKK